MKTVLLVTVVVITLLAIVVYRLDRAQMNTIDASIPPDFPHDDFSHQSFEGLLKEYVNEAGDVDYDAWNKSGIANQQLNSYLAAVSLYSPDKTPERFATRNDTLAYWLYAYNAYVIRGVLDHWPLKSVTDIKAPVEVVKGFGFFYQQQYVFGGEHYSLLNVENQKIRATYKDARIHFVLNCASGSCPVLRPELPTGDALEPFLQNATLEFVSDDRNVFIDHANETIYLSTIFKWFRKDFINDLTKRGLPTENGTVGYIASVASEDRRSELLSAVRSYEVKYRDYDWSLNGDDSHLK
jgi:hypothetical protein